MSIISCKDAKKQAKDLVFSAVTKKCKYIGGISWILSHTGISQLDIIEKTLQEKTKNNINTKVFQCIKILRSIFGWYSSSKTMPDPKSLVNYFTMNYMLMEMVEKLPQFNHSKSVQLTYFSNGRTIITNMFAQLKSLKDRM